MRVVAQKVKKSNVRAEGKVIGKIGEGILVFLAVHQDDEEVVIPKMVNKIINLRIFGDRNNKMNLSLKDVGGEVLVVSQFTLYGDCDKGNRPSFMESARPDKAKPYYEKFIKCLKENGIKTASGKFGAMMEVELVNDGPVTIILNS